MGVSFRNRRSDRRQVPAVEGLESRSLLSSLTQSQSYRQARATHKYHEYVSELQRIELKSQATPEESLALSDAARALGTEAAAKADPATQARALAATLQLDQAPLYGWVGAPGWALVRTRLTANLDALKVPATAIDQAIAAMQAVARSAGVTADDFQTLTAKEASYQNARSVLRNPTVNLPDPETYYAQHLRGFFRGQAVAHRQGDAALNADLQSIQAAANDTPAQAEALHRDAQRLQQIGEVLTSVADERLGTAFIAAFDHGAPGDQDQATLRAEFQALIGPAASPATQAAADQLIADSGSFFQAAGSSQDNVRTITTDVQTLVADGGGAPANPFKVQIRHSPLARG